MPALLGAIAAVGIVLVPAGTAKPPASEVKKYDACLQYDGSPVCYGTRTGGSPTTLPSLANVELTLKVRNDSTSNQTLGSVNLDAPSQISIDPTTVAYAPGSPGTYMFGTNTSTQIQLRNLSLVPGGEVSVTFDVATPCGGSDLPWGMASKQSNSFLGAGNDFSLILSTGLRSDIQGACTPCEQGQDCNTDAFFTGNTVTTVQAVGGNFLFIGIGVLDLGGRIPAGCAGFEPVSDGPIHVVDQRTSLSGELYVTYGIKKQLIQKKFGNNQGQQFIPICAGAKRIELVGGKTQSVDCDDPYGGVSQAGSGWWGKELGTDGKFTGNLSQAQCDADTGFFFGILGSFQDYTNSNPGLVIDPSTSPTVVEWSSDATYRYFTSRWPSASGPGPFANVPWDGWKFG